MTHDNVTDIVGLLEALAGDCEETDGWQDAAPTCRQAATQLATLRKQLENAREAFGRQADNMAFVINHMDLPPQWYEKFTKELEEDREALKGQP